MEALNCGVGAGLLFAARSWRLGEELSLIDVSAVLKKALVQFWSVACGFRWLCRLGIEPCFGSAENLTAFS